MKFVKKIILFFSEPGLRMAFLSTHGFYRHMSDKEYLRCQYRRMTGRELDLENPKTLNEKLQWLKLYDRRLEYTTMVDKYAVKKWVAERIGEEYIIPTLGVWEHFDDIDFDALPDQFVLKCTHDSGSVVIVKNKVALDKRAAKRKLEKCLKRNLYWTYREWPYRDVTPRIIAEEYLHQQSGEPIADYKFYCYGGKAQYFMYSLGEVEHNVRNHKFNMQLQSIDHLFKQIPKIDAKEISLPENMEQMIRIVNILCAGTQHLRVDLYNIDGHIYFGELTFYSGGGYINIESVEYSQRLADLISILNNGDLK